MDLVLDNRALNIFDNIGKGIDFFVMVLLEYSESSIFFLEFRFLICTKVGVDSRAKNNNSLSRSFY
jgi:hypothetical protein